MNNQMITGISFNSGFLAETRNEFPKTSIEEAFQTADEALSFVKECGVESIEIASSQLDNTVNKAIEKIRSYDLGFTIHGIIENVFKKESSISSLNSAEEALPIITFHPQKSSGGNLHKAIKNNISQLQEILRKHEILIALEINREREKTGLHCFNVLNEIRIGVQSERIGFCWDVGHSYWNYSQHSDAEIPPDSFLNHVIHTHIHDHSPDGETHWPLSQGIVPIKTFLEILKQAGYRGVLNLELYTQRWDAEMDIKNEVRDSILKLREMIIAD